jgi:hypothetical protein
MQGMWPEIFAVLDVYRRYKQFKPQGIAGSTKGNSCAGAGAGKSQPWWMETVSKNQGRREWMTCKRSRVGIVACSGEELAEEL